MKKYLDSQVGKKLGVVRAGMPKEVYFEAVVLSVGATAAVFRCEDGKELALALDKIIMAGSPEAPAEEKRHKPGFL